MNIKELFRMIDEVASPRGYVKPGFSKYHVYLALIELGFKGPLGRKSLASILGIGEGSVRTLIKRLLSFELVTIDNVAGVLLTEKGVKAFNLLKDVLVLVGSFDFNGCEFCRDCRLSIIILRRGVELIKLFGGVLVVRDLIVKYGGVGSIILYYINDGLRLPDSKELHSIDSGSVLIKLVEGFNISNGDSVLVAMCNKGDDNCLRYVVEATLDIVKVVGN